MQANQARLRGGGCLGHRGRMEDWKDGRLGNARGASVGPDLRVRPLLFIFWEGRLPCRPIFLLPTRIEINKSNGTEAVPPIKRRTWAKMALLGGQLGDLPLPGLPC